MEILKLSEAAAKKAARIIQAGGVVLYPTDTLYGLGADASSDEAVAEIFKIKGRNEGKPIHAIVADIAMAREYGEVSDAVANAIGALPRGQVTFVVPKRVGLDTGIAKNISTFGFRIPDNDFCIEMVRAFGKSVTATSANRAGEKPLGNIDAILAQLGNNAQNIDLVIDAGELPARKASSVVDLSGAHPRILREGTVSAEEIQALLG